MYQWRGDFAYLKGRAGKKVKPIFKPKFSYFLKFIEQLPRSLIFVTLLFSICFPGLLLYWNSEKLRQRSYFSKSWSWRFLLKPPLSKSPFFQLCSHEGSFDHRLKSSPTPRFNHRFWKCLGFWEILYFQEIHQRCRQHHFQPFSSTFIYFHLISSTFIHFHPRGLPWSVSDHHRMVLN